MEKKLKITLVKSTIGALKDQQATVKALGLKKTNSTVEQPDNACIRAEAVEFLYDAFAEVE